MLSVVVVAAAVAACAAVARVASTSRGIAAHRFLADSVALAAVTGDIRAADEIASRGGCRWTLVARKPLSVVVRLDDACGSVVAAASLER